MTIGIKTYSSFIERDKKLFAMVDTGVSVKEVSETFNISKNRVRQLIKRRDRGIKYRIYKNI